jgi:hypothetical protein
MTLMSPTAISRIDKDAKPFSVPGLSCFGGGLLTRAIEPGTG